MRVFINTNVSGLNSRPAFFNGKFASVKLSDYL